MPIHLRARRILLVMAASIALATPVLAQFSDSYNFLKAVRARDGNKVTELVTKPGSIIINTRDDKSSETALHIVTKGRDLNWMNFLISRGARVDLRDGQGNTALMLTSQLGFVEGAQALVASKASVDLTNNAGETPLIRAVQLRNAAMVQLLLNAGANPAKADTLAGLTARDYATRDLRAASILKLLDNAKPVKAKTFSGPKL